MLHIYRRAVSIMKQFISNYIILPDGRVLNNYIVKVSQEGYLIELLPFSEELAYTIYVPNPILIIPEYISYSVDYIFKSSSDIAEFCNLLSRYQSLQSLNKGDKVTIMELDFQQKYKC